jgi:DNA polymerase III epsilon subunit-like protein
MRLQIDKIKEKNIIIFDIEYDQNSLVQLAFLILSKTEPNIFELTKSVNVYVKQNHSLNPFFIRYTNITNEFLCDNGIDLAGAKALVDEAMLDIDMNKTMVVSHGLDNDLQLLYNNKINFKKAKGHYCTYNAAKRLLNRENHLTLQDVAQDSGYYMFNSHNAYADVWGTLHAFCFLKEIESGTTN